MASERVTGHVAILYQSTLTSQQRSNQLPQVCPENSIKRFLRALYHKQRLTNRHFYQFASLFSNVRTETYIILLPHCVFIITKQRMEKQCNKEISTNMPNTHHTAIIKFAHTNEHII